MVAALMGAIALVPSVESAYANSDVIISQANTVTAPDAPDEETISKAWTDIRAAQDAETPDQAASYLVEAAQIADQIQDPTRRQQIWAAIATEYAAIGQMDAAIALLDRVDYNTYAPEYCCTPFRLEVETAIAQAYAKTEQMDAALTFAESIEAEFARAQVLEALIEQRVQANDLDGAIALLDRIRTDEYQLARAQHSIVRGYITNHQFHEGLVFSQTMTNADERSGALFNVAQGAVRAGDYSIAQQIAQEISSPWTKLEAFRITAIAYAGIGNTDAARELIDQGYAELQAMPDNQSFSYWIRNYAEIGAYDEAIRRAEQLTIAYDQAEAYIFIGQVLVQHGRFEEAFKLAQRVDDGELQVLADYEDPKVLLLNDIVKQTALNGQYDIAMQVARTYGQPEDRVYALQGIAEQARLIGNPDQASLILQEAFDLAKTIEKIGDYVDRHMYFETSNAGLLMAIAEDFSKLNDAERAIAALNAAVESAQSFEGTNYYDTTESQLRIWLTLAQNYSNLQQAEQAATVLELATELANTTEDGGLRAQRLARIGQAYGRMGRPAQAQTLLSEALQLSASITDGAQKLGTMSAIAEGYAVLGDDTTLQAIAQQFLQAAQSLPDAYQQNTVLGQAALALAAAPDPTLAFQLVNAMPDEMQRAQVLADIAAKYRAANRPEQAKTATEQLTDSTDRIWDAFQRDSLLSSLIYNQYAAPSTVAPAWSYALASDLNTIVHDPKARATNAFAIAIGYARLGDQEQAEISLASGLEALTQVSDRATQQDALWISLDEMLLADELELAVSLVRGFNDPQTRIAILRRLAQSYAQNGDMTQANAVMDQAVNEAEAIADLPNRMSILNSLNTQRTAWSDNLTYSIPL
ncbi:MAG: hypothetical protein IGR76_11460 [Synechococcales cyanobacterium T60_A2020_003]|nr:hypothetical protein [Synechococcales cyanobacterium T60_A2020_003]